MSDEKPLYIYVAGPLSAPDPAGREANVVVADRVTQRLAQMGHYPFCPHTQSSRWFEAPDAEIRALARDHSRVVGELDFAWLRKCDALFLLPGWEQSKGAQMEHTEALRLGLAVYARMEDVPNAKAQDL